MPQVTATITVKFAWWYRPWLHMLTLWAVLTDKPVNQDLVKTGYKRCLRVKVE